MAIGRTFPESLQKAHPLARTGPGRAQRRPRPRWPTTSSTTTSSWPGRARPHPGASSSSKPPCAGASPPTRWPSATGVDPWFLDQLADHQRGPHAARVDGRLGPRPHRARPAHLASGEAPRVLRRADRLSPVGWVGPRARRRGRCGDRGRRPGRPAGAGVRATFKTVDTCGAEFEARTPYHYATYEDEDEVRPSERPRVVILGSGPNRIGQGIEFDYCCVHASMALRAAGYETVMVNCNPETVSTDYDTSDRLYFEPITAEDVANVLDAETAAGSGPGGAPVAGVIVSLGGQTPLKLAHSLPPELVLGTSPASIDLAEDRERWNAAVRAPRDPPARRAASPCRCTRPSPWRRRSGTRCSSGPVTCSAAGPWRSSTTTSAWRVVVEELAGIAGPRGGRHRRAPRARRPVPRGRRRGRRGRACGTGPARCSSPGSWSTWRRRACTRATRRARSRPRRCRPR